MWSTAKLGVNEVPWVGGKWRQRQGLGRLVEKSGGGEGRDGLTDKGNGRKE